MGKGRGVKLLFTFFLKKCTSRVSRSSPEGQKTKLLPYVLVRLQTPEYSPYGKVASKDRSIYIKIYII